MLNRPLFFAAALLAPSLGSGVAFAQSPESYIARHAIEIKNLSDWPEALVPLLSNYRVIFIGENHGSNEPPSAVAGLTSLLKKSGKDVIVALEVWQSQQQTISEYLQTGQQDILKRSPFYTDSFQDGRRSKAMVRLLEQIRQIGGVRISCFDPVEGPVSRLDNQLRNTAMAVNLAKLMAENPESTLVVLTGNLHSMLSEAEISGQKLYPAAYLLTALPGAPVRKEEVLSLYVRDEKGAAWLCTNRCGLHNWGPYQTNYSRAVAWNSYALLDSDVFSGHNGSLFIRRQTASEPFVK